ncbi:MAG: trypsin-like peptidase domain-containing protein [Dehalococcoidales bacterium]|nr:trypsin-like peptidase domain-containing protein [Dehalococcoidales bacterium]
MLKYFRVTAVVLAMVLIVTGCTAQQKTSANTTAATTTMTSATTGSQSPASVSGLESAIEAVYAAANPSVVNIQVLLAATSTSPGGAALGSGFVWDTQGDIVTNNHVIDGATRITVTFYDGTIVDATLVGTDVDSDLAVIKVSANTALLKPVTMADSTQVQVGQLAVAIGNPFGFQGTMTVGFISGIGRLLPSNLNATGPSYSIPDVIQTDASINPGNSGGILLDSAAKVLGVTQSIESTSGSSSGVGFAIPSAIVKQVVPALISTGHYTHPYLGISASSLNPDINAAMNLPADQRGALVQTVTSGGPADKAGLKASANQTTINGQSVPIGGDVIVAFNGQAVRSSDDLITFLARSGSVGQTVTLTILRNGSQTQLSVTLGARPNS